MGYVRLTWIAPTQNAGGSPITELVGHKFFYGASSRNYDHEIHIGTPGVTTCVVKNLVPDIYFFAATSHITSGVESNYSGEAVRTVD